MAFTLSPPVSENLAHLGSVGISAPGWGLHQVWDLAGADPSVSIYDADFGASHSNVDQQIRAGTRTVRSQLPPSNPTITRSGVVSAQHNTFPAARYFQSYTGAGTGQSWSSDAMANTAHTTLHMNFNLNAQGAAELHPGTVFEPFPSPSSLYPKVV